MLNKMRVFSLLDTQTRTRLMGQIAERVRGKSEDVVVDDRVPPPPVMASAKAAAVDASLMAAML